VEPVNRSPELAEGKRVREVRSYKGSARSDFFSPHGKRRSPFALIPSSEDSEQALPPLTLRLPFGFTEGFASPG
jgi:hypothetical protein